MLLKVFCDLPGALLWPCQWQYQLWGSVRIRVVEKLRSRVGVQASTSGPAANSRLVHGQVTSSLRVSVALWTLRALHPDLNSMWNTSRLKNCVTFFVVASHVKVTGSVLLIFEQVNVVSCGDTVRRKANWRIRGVKENRIWYIEMRGDQWCCKTPKQSLWNSVTTKVLTQNF